MSRLTEYRWNRDWGMVKLAPHSAVGGSRGYYDKIEADAMLAKVTELKAANKQLRKWREDLISDIAVLEDHLRGKPCPHFKVIKRCMSYSKELCIYSIRYLDKGFEITVVDDGD